MLLLVDLEEDEATVARTNDEVDVGVLLLAGHEVAREGAAMIKVDFTDELARDGDGAALERLDVASEDQRVLHGLFLLLLALNTSLRVPTLLVLCQITGMSKRCVTAVEVALVRLGSRVQSLMIC